MKTLQKCQRPKLNIFYENDDSISFQFLNTHTHTHTLDNREYGIRNNLFVSSSKRMKLRVHQMLNNINTT